MLHIPPGHDSASRVGDDDLTEALSSRRSAQPPAGPLARAVPAALLVLSLLAAGAYDSQPKPSPLDGMTAGTASSSTSAPTPASASASAAGATASAALNPSLGPPLGPPLNLPLGTAQTAAAAHSSVAPQRRAPPKRDDGMVDRWGYVEIPARTTFAMDGRFDVLIHFHGGGLDGRAEKAKLAAVLVSTTLGDGSGKYQELFSQGYTLDKAMRAIERAVRKQSGVADARIGRLALSSFSAGYGAIAAILRDPDNDRRIDALLMADGIHVDFSDAKRRRLSEPAMARYLRFARACESGDKLFLLTHSEVPSAAFASTSETASYLIEQLGLPKARRCPHNRRLSVAACHARAGIMIGSYYGGGADNHMAHAYGQHGTMYRRLRRHWSRPPVRTTP